MILGKIFCAMVALALTAALLTGNGSALAAATAQGAQAGVTLAVSMAGALCLWTGVGHVMKKAGLTGRLAALLCPILRRIFPSYRTDPVFAENLSANVCANFLGLGNAATPMGIQAAKNLAQRSPGGTASDELCRLVVMNTASIQLIPATVAALRTANGCATPFDLLPAVWLTSVLSVSAGLLAAWFLGKVWRHD